MERTIMLPKLVIPVAVDILDKDAEGTYKKVVDIFEKSHPNHTLTDGCGDCQLMVYFEHDKSLIIRNYTKEIQWDTLTQGNHTA